MTIQPAVSPFAARVWAPRLLAAALVAVIVVLSLLPGSERPHTGLKGQYEHVVAYAGAIVLLSLAARRPAQALWVAGFAALSVSLEIAQGFIPGRTSQVVDVLASTGGAAAGAVLSWLVFRAFRRPAVRPALDPGAKAG